jgi:hypothetical protein
MKSRLIIVMLATFMLLGCNATGRMYPVQGPLSKQTPLPVFIVKLPAPAFSIGSSNSGNISTVLNDGEICTGRWEIVRPVSPPKGAAVATDPTANNMSAEWDAVYGPGFYVAHVLGARLHIQAVVTGNRDTVLNVEMYRSDSGENNARNSIKGVAEDNKGNVYKLTF